MLHVHLQKNISQKSNPQTASIWETLHPIHYTTYIRVGDLGRARSRRTGLWYSQRIGEIKTHFVAHSLQFDPALLCEYNWLIFMYFCSVYLFINPSCLIYLFIYFPWVGECRQCPSCQPSEISGHGPPAFGEKKILCSVWEDCIVCRLFEISCSHPWLPISPVLFIYLLIPLTLFMYLLFSHTWFIYLFIPLTLFIYLLFSHTWFISLLKNSDFDNSLLFIFTLS